MSYVRIVFVALVLTFANVSFVHADAASDLMSALGMTPPPESGDSIDAVSATNTDMVASTTPAADDSEKIAELKALIVKLTTQLAVLLKARSAAAAATVSVADQVNAGICGLHRTLSVGVDGNDVKILQRFLVSEGLLAASSVSGSYGSLTEKAVQTWQAQAGIIDHGDAYTTGYGLINDETLSMMRASCLTESAINRDVENAEGATKDFFVKKVPMTLQMTMGSSEKNMELSYTVKETSRDPKLLRLCSMLLDEKDVALTNTSCRSLDSYGAHTETMSADFGLLPNPEHTLHPGHNIVKLKLELFDPTQTSFDLNSRQTTMQSLGTDDTGTFDLYVGVK